MICIYFNQVPLSTHVLAFFGQDLLGHFWLGQSCKQCLLGGSLEALTGDDNR
jgi:hypothetical protein